MNHPSVHDVASDPQWLPHTYDAEGANLTSVLVPRAARSELIFLSDRHFAGNFAKAQFPAQAVAAAAGDAEQAPIHFIFHSSHCCSTLLARALDVPGRSSLLNEPDVLINLSNRLIRSDDGANRDRVELVLRLLERPFARGETVIVKPSNFGQRVAEVALASRPGSRAILLYSDLETLLLSILKRGMFGRIFGRQMFAQLNAWSPLDFGYGPAELLEQTDVQIAALAWLMQIHHLDALAKRFGERVTVIDSRDLLAQPAAALQRAQAHFGLGLDPATVEAIASGPVFSTHAKTPGQPYNAEARAQEHAASRAAHAEEIGMVLQWIEAVAAQVGAPLRPGL
jgi:hypothetical protein